MLRLVNQIDGKLAEDKVTKVEAVVEEVGLGNVITRNHLLVVNGVLGSYRVENDFPDALLNIGTKIYDSFGLTAAHHYCRFGDWFRKTRAAKLLA